MKFNYKITILLILMSCQLIDAQVAINEDNADPDASAMLDVKSTNKGVLTPQMTTTQRTNIGTPATGLLVFDLTTSSFWLFNGTAWEELLYTSNDTQIQDTDGDTKMAVSNDIVRFSIKNNEVMNFDLLSSRVNLLNNNNNTFVGYQSGQSNTGSNNSFLGYQAGKSVTNGSDNSFIGNLAGSSHSSQSSNTYVGYNAGGTQNLGNYNTYVGSNAAGNKTSGSNNTIVGYNAGLNNLTGSGNVFIGYEAGKNETGSNKLYIDNSSTTTPLIYGDFSTDELTLNGKLGTHHLFLNNQWISGDGDDEGIYIASNARFGFGTSSPNADIHVGGDMYIDGNITHYNDGFSFYDRNVNLITARINSAGVLLGNFHNSTNISSVTKNGAGDFTINFSSGTFTEEPIITATANKGANGDLYSVHLLSSTTSSVRIKAIDSSGSAADTGMFILIVGER